MACGVLLMVSSLSAQDIHFSQFYMSPLNLNPALTGVMNCNIRMTANYRSQYASILKSNAYKTYNFSYDQRIPVGRFDYFGVGATMWGDVAGELDFGMLTGKISMSYSKRVGGYRQTSHYLALGAEGGIIQYGVNYQNSRFGNQHDGEGQWDGNIPSNETLERDRFIVGDISAGLLWFSVLDKENSFYMGMAMSHLNRANVSFDDTQVEPLYTKFTVHGGGDFALTQRLGLVPNIVTFIQGPDNEVNLGLAAKFRLGKSRLNYQAFQIGPWVRLSNELDRRFVGESIILAARFDYNKFALGFNYDININELTPATNNNGAFEFSLQYKICPPERRGVYCPTNF